MWTRDGKNSDPGSLMEKSRIRDKHPGSATMPLIVKMSHHEGQITAS